MGSNTSRTSSYQGHYAPSSHSVGKMADPQSPPSPARRGSSFQPTTFSIPPSRGFIPVTESKASALSTRGQRLSQLIQHRAGSDQQPGPLLRRNSSRLVDGHAEADRVDLERGTGAGDEQQSEHREPRLERSRTDTDQNFELPPAPPSDFPLLRPTTMGDKRASVAPNVLDMPMMRSHRLIGSSNPKYRWEQYYKSEEVLKTMKKPLRKYYERNNYLIQQYLYIDRLLDSSLPHNLIQEYNTATSSTVKVPPTIREESSSHGQPPTAQPNNNSTTTKVKRTKDLYKVPEHHLPTENTPLLNNADGNPDADAHTTPIAPTNSIPAFSPDEEASSADRIVTVAIYLNLAANAILLALKIIVTVLTSSLSVLASLVDAALDFLSTAIVWTTTHLINSPSPHSAHNYPVGRRRLEPIGVLVFSVIMITSFVQVALESVNRLTSPDRTIVQLTPAAIGIMAATVAVKALCWLWCRLIKNSSVQALAQDAVTDVIFNIFSIIFPLLGYALRLWFLDPLGGLLLSLYVIISWSLTTRTHILNLTGHAASADERNILLYLTMRFAKSVRRIQGCTAYHAGDKLNVEVDIVLDEEMSLRDSHDLGESLQYVLESVPGVERAFVHTDYADWNIATHLEW